ncbi:oligosaccharide flippase family protein [Brachybacterium vulturis]|uniref:oligosaccharide flippase family protein n=1 Tax=Brachybacterium vulturis TaxID=2017484 RepID=UPI0037356A4B
MTDESGGPKKQVPSFLRNVLHLFTGSAVAQVVTMGALLATARLYGDESFGALALYTSTVAIVVPIASLRYNFAIMLPEEDHDAWTIVQLSQRIVLMMAVLSSLVVAAVVIWGPEGIGGPYAAWLPLCGVSIFLLGQSSVLGYWLNRQGEFAKLARNNALLASGTGASQIGLGLPRGAGASGLIVGTIFGQFVACVRLFQLARASLPKTKPDRRRMVEMAKEHVRMPLLNGTTAIMDAIRLNGINFLIGAGSVAALGQYNMAWRLTMAPMSLMNAAISQVLFHRLARSAPGEMTPLLRKIIVRLAAVGLPCSAGLYLLSPTLFPLFLGAEWVDAGEFARSLTPWLLLMFVSSPISTVFIVANRQGVLLVFSILYAAAPLLFVSLYDADLHVVITVMSWIMAVLLAVVVGLALWVARRFDARQQGS